MNIQVSVRIILTNWWHNKPKTIMQGISITSKRFVAYTITMLRYYRFHMCRDCNYDYNIINHSDLFIVHPVYK